MILDLTTKKLQVVLAGAITTNQLQVNASWGDTQSGDTFVPGATSALTNSATPVDIVAAPSALTQRTVREVTVFNADTVAATVTVQTVDGANTRINTTATIQSGETLMFANGVWNTLTTSGAVKGSAGVSSVALTVPARQTVTGSPITTAGTLAVTDNTQAANTLFAGPASGAAAGPTFRLLGAADLNSLAFTTGSVLFGNASGGIGQDNGKIFWDDTNFRLGVGTYGLSPDSPLTVNANTGVGIAAQAGTVIRAIAADGASGRISIQSYGSFSIFQGQRADGTRASPAALATNTSILILQASGYDGATMQNANMFITTTTEAWTSTARGIRVTINTTKTGTVANATAFVFENNGNYTPTGARCDNSQSYQTPLTGATITQADTSETLICDPAGAIAALTVNTPVNPLNGQRFQFTCTQGITLLTIQASAGQTLKAPVAAVYVANTAFGWQYRLANTTWYRVHS